MRGLALAAAVLAAGALAAPAPAARVPERGFDLVVSARPPIEPRTPTLFSLDPETGERTRLSRTTRAHESSPTASPDGRLLAFVRGALGTTRTVWIARADGSRPRLIGEGTSPAWSPDSRQLAYAGPEGVLVARFAGGPGRLVAPDGAFPAFSPDGTLLAYLVSGGSVPSRLEVVDPNGGTPRTVLAEAGPFAWSPDGRALAVRLGLATTADRGALLLVGLDGRVAWRVEPRLLSHAPAFAPDGGFVALLADDGSAVRYRASDGASRPLARGCTAPFALAPDGRRLACLSSATSDHAQPRVVDLATGRARTLGRPQSQAEAIAWRGGVLVVSEVAAGEDLGLFRVEPSTGERIRITDDRVDQADPTWSPDGRRILFYREGVPMTARADGTQPRPVPLPAGSAAEQLLTWSPDSRAVLLIRRTGRLDLLPLGGGPVLRGRVPPPAPFRRDAAWSPQHGLAYATAEGIVVVPLARKNGALAVGESSLIVPGGFWPRWSPDASRLLFARFDDPCCDTPFVWARLVNGSGEEPVAVPEAELARDVAWAAPDAVAVVGERTVGGRVLIIPTGAATRVLPLRVGPIDSFDWRAPLRRP